MTLYDPTVSVIRLEVRRRRRRKREEEQQQNQRKHSLLRYAYTTNFLNGEPHHG